MLRQTYLRFHHSLRQRGLSTSSASFLSPKDFLDTNSPALTSLSNNPSSHESHPATIKLGVQLSKYGVNMTKLAQEGKLESVIGREIEIQQAIQVLTRRKKNNPCLIGEPGVGKTSIAEGLANLISKGHVPESMKDKVIVSLDLASMLAGTKFRGEFEERLKGVLKEIEQAGDRIILFIDEIHCLVGAGGSDGAIDASNILKPSLARGQLKCLGTTTIDEYSRHIEKDAALARRFQPIYVAEPTEEQTIKIINGLKIKYETHHKVIIHDETIIQAVKYAGRYYPSKRFPDKAIDLIDEAASRLRNKNETIPLRITEIDSEIDLIQLRMNESLLSSKDISVKDELLLFRLQEERLKILQAWKDQNQMISLIFNTQTTIQKLKDDIKTMKRNTLQEKEELFKYIDSIRNNEKTIQDLYHSLNCSNTDSSSALSKKSNSNTNNGFRNTLEVKDIAEVVSADTGIPIDSMLVKESTNGLTHMESELKQQIIGQDGAIDVIAKCIRLSKAGLRFHDRPIGVFLFLGPTGVGKTELAKAVNSILFKDQPASSNILRIDMSEYMERFSVSRLIGAPPGYVGYDEGGVLTDAVRRRPYQLVLLDEFEKAHREVSNLLLQVFDEGRLTDSQGRVVDFRNTVVIMTSNLGSDVLNKLSEEYLSNKDDNKDPESAQSNLHLYHQRRREVATKLVHQHFSPEFVNRLDDVIVFNSLTTDGIIKICSIQLKKVKQLLQDKGIGFHFSAIAAEQIALSGSNLQYGARPLKRLIQNEILSPLATKILNGEVRTGDELYISAEGDSQQFMHSTLPQGTVVDPNTFQYFKLELAGDSDSDGQSANEETVTESDAPKVTKRVLEVLLRKSTTATAGKK